MTVALRPRTRARLRDRPASSTEDLSAQGVHRDPAAHDPIAAGGFAQRLVHKASALLSGGTSTRRSFLTRTAVVGSALAVGPIDFILKPGTAYGALCGTCTDGWTAFCCTINAGRNSCPPGSFVAGWWKADNAAYCCGAARYIIDCNATCPTQCRCRCSGASCDGRKTCCNQFRYGQCNQQIACYGPVVCRVATCTVPWRYDPRCTTSSATDNRTVTHGAPCLTTDCDTPISRKYDSLGGTTGRLGPPITGEEALGDAAGGRRRRYQNGAIYWTNVHGAHEVRGSQFREYDVQGGYRGRLGYPTSDTVVTTDGTRYVNTFERGRIYSTIPQGVASSTFGSFHTKWIQVGGPTGFLGYPTRSVSTSADGASQYIDFQRGRIYARAGTVVEIHGAVWSRFAALRGTQSQLRYPVADLVSVGDGGKVQRFQGGNIYYTPALGAWGVWGAVLTRYAALGATRSELRYPISDLVPVGDGRGKLQLFQGGSMLYTPTLGAHGLWGPVLARYAANGGPRGYLRYPISSVTPVGDGRGVFASFEYGNIYASPTTSGHQVHGAVLTYYFLQGGPRGALGYPTSDLDPSGTPGGRFQSFEGGRIRYEGGTVSPA